MIFWICIWIRIYIGCFGFFTTFIDCSDKSSTYVLVVCDINLIVVQLYLYFYS